MPNVRISVATNRLVVGAREELFAPGCLVENINWICTPPEASVDVRVRLRHRHKAVPATVFPKPDGKAIVRFQAPASSVTPGQGAVFFRNDEVLGGGWIVGSCDGVEERG